MKIKIRKEELVKALDKVSCSLGEKNEPILTKNIGIEARKDSLRFVSSSQKMCAEYIMNVGDDLEIETTGKIVIDGVDLFRNVSNFHSGVIITASIGDSYKSDEGDDKSNLELSYVTKLNEKWEHTHNLIDVTRFPEIDFTWVSTHSVTYSSSQFMNGISRVLAAASDEEHRPKYNAVMMGFSPDGIEFFASDGRQMAYSKDSGCSSADTKKALIQSHVIGKIAKKNIIDSSGDVEVSISESDDSTNGSGKVRIRQNTFVIITNLADNVNLLPYEKILGLKPDLCGFYLNAGLLKDDLKVFSSLENRDSQWVFSPNGIKVSSVGNFERKSEGFISGVENYTGGSCSMRLSLKYWDTLLSKCDNNVKLKIYIQNERLPIIIEASQDPSLYKFFIMPMNDAD